MAPLLPNNNHETAQEADLKTVKATNINSFVLFARDLSITWGSDERYWKWTYEKETSGAYVEVAELLKVCWFEVKGKFDTKKLTPGTFYRLAFLVKFNEDASGWENLVNLKLDLPNGTQIQRKENFKNKPKNKWIEILVAEFRVQENEKQGEMEFSMTETSDFHWKSGIVLNGVVIQPAL
ncbi:protein PHLOEM PROTEIN 2-LIKE A1-like [Mangifera indica]|uniref:protein PHLOEM PROTEIN 2-LIKE A1-like n=1 Tax=Mangifera indica TaxID=29780 RepID=UPI001CFAD716|nr:protein PHLOEM PROTEIN 2-LIKE A1-like [Mangifera indica]